MKAIIMSKSNLWEYEREYRAMLILPGLKKRTLKNGAIGYFRAFPPRIDCQSHFRFSVFICSEDPRRLNEQRDHGLAAARETRSK